MGIFRFGQTTAILYLSLLLTSPQLLFAADEADNDMLWTMLLNWFPMLLLIGVWIYFMKNMKTKKMWGHSEETDRHLEKIGQALDRIAKALEKK